MNSRTFFLKPFPSGDVPQELKISCEIGRSAENFSLCYELLCPVSKLVIPVRANKPERRSGLWENTCLEFFISPKGSDSYWEFNLSPSGDWNVYRFESYRRGMREEQAFTCYPFNVTTLTGSLRVFAEVNLGKIAQSGHALEVGISAVIKAVDESRSYWALAHTGNCPDFHRRDCFLVEL
jgi:hypothetical protein